MPIDMQPSIPASIASSLSDFTGREWVFRRLNTWLEAVQPRTYLLTGGPGCGKSTVAARLVQISLGEKTSEATPLLRTNCLACFHFCQARFDSTLNPLRFVASISQQLAIRYQTFADALLEIGDQEKGITINASQTVGTAARGAEVKNVVIDSLQISNLSARTAFDRLVRKPLERLCTYDFRETILILVDSLDKAVTYDPDDNIVTLLGRVVDDGADLPSQLRFLLTGTAPHGGGQFGQLSHSLDSMVDSPYPSL